ncbi:DsbA family oxidoreductase [Paenibacillus sp. 481]|uniref:DsbA family oxidoreductase n=1 Tax=Paenibacillus sp. 481 TaxID=2835869 RepID=UPI001E611D3A|nr:DsbA family oxidoreductase [Paenibacillus sp. 481]UHA73745.1 DsbA family oxidoreductase [Paenibacillus sp. 481]
MKIEVWSDYVCPFCYIGKRQLEKAIQDSGYEDQIEVEYKSFELDPTTPTDTNELMYAVLERKYSMSEAEVKKMTVSVAARAAEVGLEYHFDNMLAANTNLAHRLAKLAKEEGKDSAYNERLMQAYFTENKAIGQPQVLKEIALELGLNMENVEQMMATNLYENQVEQDIYAAQQIGVRGVPFFVINNNYGISGAQPQSLFEQTIEKAASEAGLTKSIKIVGNSGATCSDGQCN